MNYNLTEFKNIIHQKVDADLTSLPVEEVKEIKMKLELYSQTDFTHEKLPNTAINNRPAQLANTRQPDDYYCQANDLPSLNQGTITNNLTLAQDRLDKVSARLTVLQNTHNKQTIQNLIDNLKSRLTIYNLSKEQENLFGKDWAKKFENQTLAQAQAIEKDLQQKIEKKLAQGGGSPGSPIDVEQKIKDYLVSEEGKALLSGIDLAKEIKETGLIGKKLKELVEAKGSLSSEDVKKEIKSYLASEEGKKELANKSKAVHPAFIWTSLVLGALAFIGMIFLIFTRQKESGGYKVSSDE